jgi:hypothetical protein
MAEENPFEHMQQFLSDFKGDINIIDEKIDIKLQIEYFDMSKDMKGQTVLSDWEEKSEMLNDISTPLEAKKKILVQLASMDDVKAYRIIENFTKIADGSIKHWSLLALQESRMLLQSKLLDQSQVLISTGLGGKENKLRYFFVIFSSNELAFSDFQKKIIKNEFDDLLQKNNAEIEEIRYHDNIATLLLLIPLNVPIQNLIGKTISECNQYGNFLKDNCIITNVRVLDIEEIKNFLKSPEKLLPNN